MAAHDHWQDCPVPALRHEAWFGDRVVATFTPRPGSVWQLFADSAARTPAAPATTVQAGTTAAGERS